MFANFKSLVSFSRKLTIGFFFNICFSPCLLSWELLCDCSFDTLSCSGDSLRLIMSFWSLCFVGSMWLLSWWLTLAGWRLCCIVSIWSLGVRLEVDGWEFCLLFQCEQVHYIILSQASTILLLLWMFGFDGVCISCCFLFLSGCLLVSVVLVKASL